MGLNFTEKLGPLPVWGWGAIGGVIIAGGYWLSQRGGNAAQDANVSFIDDSGYQTAGITGGSATAPADVSYDNNTLWLSRAAKSVAAQLSKSPSEVYAALSKWLFGQEITTTEKGYVDTALGTVGLPPEGTQGIAPVTPNPSTPPPATAAKVFPSDGTYIITASSNATKYRFNPATGKIVTTYSVPAWAALRIQYGNNITIKTVPISQIIALGGRKE